MQLREQLRGTGVALVTPFKANTSVDFEALGKLIEFTISNGVDYLVTMGTTGETPTIDGDEKEEYGNPSQAGGLKGKQADDASQNPSATTDERLIVIKQGCPLVIERCGRDEAGNGEAEIKEKSAG